MPIVKGTLTDFGLDPLSSEMELWFIPAHAGLRGLNLLSRKPVRVTPAKNGLFEADLVSTEAVSPATWYEMEIRYLDRREKKIERLPWELRVPAAGGILSDLLRVPSNPALVFTGEKAPPNPAPGSWWQDTTGDLREFDGNGWNFKINLRGPAGYMATGAAEDDKAVAAFLRQSAGPTESGAALKNITAPGYTIPAGAGSGSKVQAAITALVGSFGLGGGDIILAAGVHTWDTTPKIPAALSAALKIRGELGAVIKLTAAGRRGFDLDWTKADQTFRNFSLSDFAVDAAASTGRNHIIIGNYINGSFLGRFNVENVNVQRIRTYGAKADPSTTNHPTHVHLTPQHGAPGEAENVIRNVYISDLDMDGGNTGIIIGGNGPNAGIEVYSDNVVIERCHFTGGVLPTKFFTTSGFHVGGKGHCGRVVIRDCVSENSGDNGFEVNAPRDALLDNCLSIDAANVGFYARNFRALEDVGHSRIEWRHCRAWVRNLTPSVPADMRGRGFMIGGDNTFGRLLYTGGCEHQVDRPGDMSEISSLQITSVGAAEVELEAFKTRIQNIDVTPTTTYFPTPISINPAVPCTVRGSFTVEAKGRRAAGSPMYFRSATIGGPSTTVDLSGVFNVELSGFDIPNVFAFDVGEMPGSTVRGRLRAVVRGNTVGRAFRIRSNMTVDRGLFLSGDCSGLAEGGVEVGGQTVEQAMNIHLSDLVFKKAPGAPTRAATGSPFTYQNTSMFPELVNVRIDGRTPGSAEVTGINYAKRGGSAIGTGATAGQFYLQNGDSLTVIYGPGEYPPVIRTQCALPTA